MGETGSAREYLCAQILRLPPGVTKPDHYTLLGLAYFEPDHGTIVRAAMERVRLLDACEADQRPGYPEAVGKLIQEVRRAQITLCDPKRRKAYDATLIGEDKSKEKKEEHKDVELRPGTMVDGRYRILGERRRGGFGIVYDALDSNLRTRVELSVLRPSLSKSRTARRRAERAARAAASLDHPNIVRVDEVGDAEGQLFVRTRQVGGKHLLEVIEATPHLRLDADQARDIARQVAEALAHAHEKEAYHGDLRPQNVVLGESGRVVVTDFCITRVVEDQLGHEPSPTRAPEGDNSAAADLYALGCVLFQMLAGMPPFAHADKVRLEPRELPDDTPDDLRVLVRQLLSPDPAQRPSDAASVVERLTPRAPARRRLGALIGVAAVLVVALAVALVMGSGGDSDTLSVVGRAWKLIADERFDEAIEKLRAAREKDPTDGSLSAPLAAALDRKAGKEEGQGDIWSAQRLLTEAQELAPEDERATSIERIRQEAIARLHRMSVRIDAVTASPVVIAEVGRGFRGTVEIGEQQVPVRDGAAQRVLKLPDGPHKVPFVLVDRVGNRRAADVETIVDTKPPAIEILEPDDGALFRKGTIRVRVRAADANLPDTVTVRSRSVRLENGEASDEFKLGDGEHTIRAVVRDRAGHEASAEVKVVVDSSAPDLEVERKRIVTRDGRATVKGTLSTKGARLDIDGRTIALNEDGSFEAPVAVAREGHVRLVATGPTGIERRMNVLIVIDRDPPRLSLEWGRKDRKGVLLYGTREMDDGALRFPLRVDDKTRVVFTPLHGKIAGRHWVVPAHEGRREIRLTAADEAGNEATLAVTIEGHRATPALTVRNDSPPHTREEEIVLEIEADDEVFVQGKKSAAGKVRLPLREGARHLEVVARDRFGNETRWKKHLVVDRTKPEITLVGDEERGIGNQELRFEANEELASLTCFGKTVPVNGRTARVEVDLKPGRRRVTVIAKDKAGNATKSNFTLKAINKVLELDGKSAVQVDIPKATPLREFTVECWVRGRAATGRILLVEKGARTSGFGIFWSRPDNTLPYAALVVAEVGFITLPARRQWRWERWTHLALSFDGQKARFFVGGSQHHVVPTEKPFIAGDDPLLIGCGTGRGKPAYFFVGAIDELRVSNVARYTRGFSPHRYLKQDENTVVLLRFDDMAGDRFRDSSKNGLHAKRIGTPRLVEESR